MTVAMMGVDSESSANGTRRWRIRSRRRGVVLVSISVLLGLGVASSLTACVFAPQLVNLLSDLQMPGATMIGTGLAFLILVASIVAKTMSAQGDAVGRDAVGRAIVVITVCVAIVRVKVVNEHVAEVRAAYDAAKDEYDEAKKTKDAAVDEAKADPDLNAKPPYLNRKREARANLAKARAIPLPPMPVASGDLGWDAWLVAVVGPVGLEAATAVLIKLLGGACGAPLAFLLALLARREEEEGALSSSTAAGVPHPVVEETGARSAAARELNQLVDVRRLDAEARLGLDLSAGTWGTWRGLELDEPKRRKGVLWPTLKREGRTVFIGSVPARRLAGEVVKTERRMAASVIPIAPRRRGLGPSGAEAIRRLQVAAG